MRLFSLTLYLTRNLREARDNAVLEKDRALAAERDIQSRYDQLLEQWVLPSQVSILAPDISLICCHYSSYNIDRQVSTFTLLKISNKSCLTGSNPTTTKLNIGHFLSALSIGHISGKVKELHLKGTVKLSVNKLITFCCVLVAKAKLVINKTGILLCCWVTSKCLCYCGISLYFLSFSLKPVSLYSLWCWCVNQQQSVISACCGCDRSLVVYNLLLKITCSLFLPQGLKGHMEVGVDWMFSTNCYHWSVSAFQ